VERGRNEPNVVGVLLSVVAGLPKAAWGITKALEKRAKKKADEAHRKRMEEIRQGKRKTYAGESFTCRDAKRDEKKENSCHDFICKHV